MIERALRWTALAIAGLAFIDPAIDVAGRTRPRLSVVVQRGPSMALPAQTGGESRLAAGRRLAVTLADRLGRDFIVQEGADASADAMVVIGDRYPEEPIAETTRVSTISLAAPLAPNVRIVDVTAPPAVPTGTAVPITATVEASGLANSTTSVVVRTAGIEVGRTDHRWTAERETWRSTLTVTPVGTPPFTFEIDAEPLPQERSVADNRALASVDLAPALRVLVVEARPSWASAFVRRALEADPRFEVSGVSEPSPRGAVRSGTSPNLDPARLDAFDAVLAGGLERLPSSTIATLDRFMRERGGAVILLPDMRTPEAIRRLMGGVQLRETLLERAAPLDTGDAPRIDASELLEAADLPAGASVVATSAASHRPVVWAIGRGRGRLLVSGAMDAWRFRADAQVAFDRFWQSVVSGLALASEPAVHVDLWPRRAAPGERVNVVVRLRPLERERIVDRVTASARIGARDPIRLWPDAAPGVFTGSFVVDPAAHGPSPVVTATIGNPPATGSARLLVDGSGHGADGPPLALLPRTRGGVDVNPSDLAALERHLRSTIPKTSARTIQHPLRSAWWLVPICSALTGEWWLRRRRGAR